MKTTILLALFVLFMGLLSGSFFWPMFAIGGGAVSALSMVIMDSGEVKDGPEEGVLIFGMIVGIAVFAYCAVVSVYTASLAMIG